jgi:hypothetical protein
MSGCSNKLNAKKCEECKGEECPHGIQMMANSELIQALMDRPTFLGVVIRSSNEVLPGQTHREFVLSCNQQICPKELAEILIMAAESILKESKKVA